MSLYTPKKKRKLRKCICKIGKDGEVREEHAARKSKYRYSLERPKLLNNIINPVTLKLTKEDDSLGCQTWAQSIPLPILEPYNPSS